MTVHIDAQRGHIAKDVLLCGDPLRARHIAELFLERPICYTHTRGMLGFTGLYKGKQISIQGTGIGIPSTNLYVSELIKDFGVQRLLRVGTCSSLQEELQLRDIVLASGTATTSNFMERDCPSFPIPQIANFSLLQAAARTAETKKITTYTGSILSVDQVEEGQIEQWKGLSYYGVLGIDMETAVLYYLAAKYQVEALSLLTVSSHLLTGKKTSARERETKFNQAAEIALDILIQ